MTPEQQKRYSRQIKLPQVGEAGQNKLLRSSVMIVGLGGLGSPVAMYLSATGIGKMILTDYDHVDESNLQRQIVHKNASIGQLKASSARETLLSIKPETEVLALDYELDSDELIEQITNADVIVDCTDNHPTRFELNRVSVLTGTPLVSGAAIRWEGLISCFFPTNKLSPCYQCLFPDTEFEAATCAMEGVIAPIVGIIGSMQAMQVINCLLRTSDGLMGKVLMFDGITMEWETINLIRNPECPACSNKNSN